MTEKLRQKGSEVLVVQETKNKLLTPKDVQSVLNIGKNTTYKLFSLKGFPKIKIGKKYFIYEDDLEKYLKSHVKSTIYV